MHARSIQSCPTLCNPWTVATQAPVCMGFSRQEYWNQFPFPSPGDLLDPSNPGLSCLLQWQVDSLPLGNQEAPSAFYKEQSLVF